MNLQTKVRSKEIISWREIDERITFLERRGLVLESSLSFYCLK